MTKKQFLEKWVGPKVGAERVKWRRAEGSSLSEGERERLKKGSTIFHHKPAGDTKIFVSDESGDIYAVALGDVYIPLLKLELKAHGFIVS